MTSEKACKPIFKEYLDIAVLDTGRENSTDVTKPNHPYQKTEENPGLIT